uniref:Uncharacterized protein n=1 Tax=Denticeps clupeoides TaxID=299321 RepID=A0AAY4ERH9_9TELE
MASHSDLELELKGWCRGEALEETHAFMVVMPEENDISLIEETLQTVKSFGRVRVRGRTFNTRLNCFLALCECKEVVKAEHVPPKVFPGDTEEAWTIVIVHQAKEKEAQSFSQKLTGLLQTEGRTMEDLRTLFVEKEGLPGSTEAILQAVGILLDKASKPTSEYGSYRRLRMFSGTLPTPAGEEQFDHWLEQARLMVEECDWPRKEKRRRLMESLRGPALEIVKAARAGDPEISPEDCIEALEHAFGSAGEDLYVAFRLLQQQPGEKLSDFLRRLEQLLDRLVQRGGLPPNCADRARLDQILRGAIVSDLMLVNLRLRERKAAPPTFLQLLKEIRAEEEFERLMEKAVGDMNLLQVLVYLDDLIVFGKTLEEHE